MRQSRQRSANRRRPFLPAILLLIATLLSGCSTFDGMFSSFKFGEDEETKSTAPETLIVEGMDAYDVGDYSTAIKAFNTILKRDDCLIFNNALGGTFVKHKGRI